MKRFPAARVFYRLAASLLLTGAIVASTAAADPVYRYRTRDGREAFTNVRSLAPSDADLEEMDLPSLIHLDLAKANEAELRRINERLARHHRALTSSAQCAEAVEDAKAPWYERVYESDPHWFGVGALLLAMALMSRFFRRALPDGMWARTVMIMLPMLLGVGIVGSISARVASTLHSIRSEATACTAELEAARAGDPAATRRNATVVHELQQMLTARQRRLQQRSDALTHDYLM